MVEDLGSILILISKFQQCTLEEISMGTHLEGIKRVLLGIKPPRASRVKSYGQGLARCWDHLAGLLGSVQKQEHKLAILDMLWAVITFKHASPGVKHQLNICNMMYFVLNNFVQLQLYQQCQDKAWELYWKVVEVTGGSESQGLMALTPQHHDVLRTDKTATLLFGAVVALITILSKTSNSKEIIHIDNSIRSLAPWAGLLTNEKANQYYSRMAYCIGVCLGEILPTLQEEITIAGLLKLYVAVGQEVGRYGGTYGLAYVINSIAQEWIGNVASSVCRESIKERYLPPAIHEIVQNCVVAIIRNVKKNREASSAHTFLQGLAGLSIDNHGSSYYHLCSIGIVTLSSNISSTIFLQLMGTRQTRLAFMESLSSGDCSVSLHQGLACLKDASRAFLDEAPLQLSEFVPSQCTALRLISDSIKLSMEDLDSKRFDPHSPKLPSRKWDLIRSAIQLYRIGARTGLMKSDDYALLSFDGISRVLAEEMVLDEDAKSVGRSFVTLAKELAALKDYLDSSRAYLSACMFYLNNISTKELDKVSIDSILHCSWRVKECLIVCGAHNLLGDVQWLREVVSMSSLNKNLSPCIPVLMRNYVQLISSLQCFPKGSVAGNTLRQSQGKENLHTVCQVGLIEMEAMSRFAPHNFSKFVQALNLVCEELKGSSHRMCALRINLLYGIALGLSGRMLDCQSAIQKGLQHLQVVNKAKEAHTCECAMESMVWGHLSYALVCAYYSQQESQNCFHESEEVLKNGRYWWSESISNLFLGLQKVGALQLGALEHKPFDVVFLADVLIQSVGLAGAQSFVGMESHLFRVLEELMGSGALENMSKRQETSLMQLGERIWVGHCVAYSTSTPLLVTKASAAAAIVSQLANHACNQGSKPLIQEWVSAFHSIEHTLKAHKDSEGFYSRIKFHLLAARACLNQGLMLKSLHHVEEALPLANGLHVKEFPEEGKSRLLCALTDAHWTAKKELISTLLLKAEILESMDMPKKAQWVFEKALEVATSIHAHAYVSVINVQQARMQLKQGLSEEALSSISSAQKSLSYLRTVEIDEKSIIPFLKAHILLAQGLSCQCVEEMNSDSKALSFFRDAKKQLLDVVFDGCLRWPVHGLQLHVEALIETLEHQNDPIKLPREFDLVQVSSILDDGFEHIAMDALSYIYSMSRLCRLPPDGVIHNPGMHGMFFGASSSMSLPDCLMDIDLDVHNPMQIGSYSVPGAEVKEICPDVMDYASFLLAVRLLSQSTRGSLGWIQVLLMCWNGFREIPGKIRCISRDLFAALAENGKLHAASYFLFASMGPAFRLQGLLRLQNVEDNKQQLQPILSLQTFKCSTDNFDVGTIDVECKHIMGSLLKRFPSSTCVLGISHHPWSRHIIIARYRCEFAPVLVMLPALLGSPSPNPESSVPNIQTKLNNFLSILKTQEDMFDGESNVSDDRDILRVWWEDRWQQECKLRDLIQTIHTQCLGEWEWLFSGEVDDVLLEETLINESKKFVAQFTEANDLKEYWVLTELVRLVLLSAARLGLQRAISAVQMLFNLMGWFPGSDLGGLVSCTVEKTWGFGCNSDPEKSTVELLPLPLESDSRDLRKSGRVSSMLHCQTPETSLSRLRKLPRSAQSRKLGCAAVNICTKNPSFVHLPSILCLDPAVQSFPWENCPYLMKDAFYRAPDLASVCAIAFNRHCSKPEKLKSSLPVVNLQSTFYVVDPEDNLPSLVGFEKQFEGIPRWKGLSGSIPPWEDMCEALNTYDMYIYLGHGSGEKAIPSKNLQNTRCRSAGLIMGCNSARLWACGDYEPSGRILDFLLAGCPAVIGNLWVVSDQDVNRYSQAIIDSWQYSGPERDSVFLAVSAKAGRSSCKFRYLVGAAPVCYGIPLEALKFHQTPQPSSYAGEVIDLT